MKYYEYKYKVKTPDGKTETGIVEAVNPLHLMLILFTRYRHFRPVSIIRK